MIKHKVSISIFLEKRNQKKDGTYPVKLRVTFQRKRKYYNLKMSMTEERFNRVFSDRARGKDYEQKIEFQNLENEVYELIKQMPVFSFELFEKELFGEDFEKVNDVYIYYDNYIKTLLENEQFSTAESYELSKNSILRFSRKKKLIFEEITPEFLTRYEKWQLKNGNSTTTIGIYLRNLRKLFNSAISDGVIEQKNYPFGKNRYQIPLAKNIKKALTLDEINKIYQYEAQQGSREEFARDIWMFSYLCNGMNMADLARLKYEDIEDGKIRFYREKTKSTSKQTYQAIVVILLPESEEIINKWGTPEKLSDNYIFPVFKDGDDAEQQKKRVKQFTKMINKYMKRISKNLEISKPVTTYSARHSFSTILKKSGAPIELISEQLGHSSILTTRAYLDSFEDETKRKFASSLTAFKKD